MFTAIYLQRRRIGFGMLFFFLAGLLDFGRFGMWEFPIYVIGMAAVFAMICGAIAALLIPLFPAYRHVFEIASVSFFALRVAETAGVAGAASYLFDTTWGFLALAIGFTLLHHGVYGAWWERTPVRLSWTGRSQFKTRAAPDLAWRRLVPAENRPGDYYSGTLHEFRAVEDPAFTHLLRTRAGGPQFIEQRVSVTRNEAGRAFAYDFDADVSEKNRALNAGHWSIDLRPLGNGTAVSVVETVNATTPANALTFWFDDLGGQASVSMKRTLEDRKDPTILGWVRRRVKAAA
ncbi:MAG: hypothetical protein QNJ13_18315 [Paracoccaceae bacterium]|nr:hypothetical protein [Paracoccaceae bacterium]